MSKCQESMRKNYRLIVNMFNVTKKLGENRRKSLPFADRTYDIE